MNAEFVKCRCGRADCDTMIPVAAFREEKVVRVDREPVMKVRRANPMIDCRCGCGGRRRRYDSHGVERFFIAGHRRLTENPQVRRPKLKSGRPAIVEIAIMALLQATDEPLKPQEIAKRCHAAQNSVNHALTRMRRRGIVRRVPFSRYRLERKAVQP